MNNFKLPNKQEGVALILTLVVLSTLTFLSLSAVDSSGLQSTMARNSQYRLETFNAANSEIDAQIDSYEATLAGIVLPNEVEYLATEGIGSFLWAKSGSAATYGLFSDIDIVANPATPTANRNLFGEKTPNTSFAKGIKLTYEGSCPTYGASIGVDDGSTTQACLLMRLDSQAQFENTNARSNQAQTFRIKVTD